MTLNTTVAIHEPTSVKDVYEACRALLRTPDAVEPIWSDCEWRQCREVAHPPGVGLPAWLIIYFGADGPLGPWKGDESETDPESLAYFASDVERNGWASIAVTFDTTYGYREENGAGCSDLHAWLVTELGAWLDGRGLTWKWENEFTCEWHDRYDGLPEFGDAAVGRLGSDIVRTRPEDGHERFVRELFGSTS